MKIVLLCMEIQLWYSSSNFELKVALKQAPHLNIYAYGRETSFPRELTKLLNIQSGVGFEHTNLRLQVFSDTYSWADAINHSAIQNLASSATPRPSV